MRFLHTADWHVGKKLKGFDLLEDQEFIFQQLVEIAEVEKVDAIVIAGDLYDRSLPAVSAVKSLNQFLKKLNLEKRFPILAISGNHDSRTRLATGSQWYEMTDFYLHTDLKQAFKPIEMQNIQFFLLPYFELFQARQYFQAEEIRTLEEAMARIIEEMKQAFDSNKQQVLVGHFFVAGSERSDSEIQTTVGGLDRVPASLFEDFSYVALGHLHAPDASKEPTVQYSGSLLKYSLAEREQAKGFKLVEIKENQAPIIQFYPVKPKRDLILLEESFETLMDPTFYEKVDREQFIGIALTDQQVIPNVMQQLRAIYPKIIHLERASGLNRTQNTQQLSQKVLETLEPTTLFSKYFEQVMGTELTAKQQTYLAESLLKIQTEED